MGLYIVILGNAVIGFRFYGPFKGLTSATGWAVDHLSGDEQWCVAPLRAQDEAGAL